MSRTEVLRRHGITDRPDIRVQTVQEVGKQGKGALWLVGINAVGDPIKTFSAKQAAEISIELRGIGEEKLANDISSAAQKAQRANQTPP